MPQKASEKVKTKLINYLKKDRPKKFKACVKKYDVDLPNTVLSKGRSFLHYAAKHGCGYFIGYFLTHGVLPSQVDKKGELPLHLALSRALQLLPTEAAEVYNTIVVPLLKNYPDALYFCDHRGMGVTQLLASLNRHILSADQSDSDSSSTDSQWSDSSSSSSLSADWSDRLAREFENESADFYGRYNYEEDYMQERHKETYSDWAERMGREMHNKRQHCYHRSGPDGATKRKRKHSSGHGDSSSKPFKGKAGGSLKEEIYKAKNAQNLDRMRKSYEERFQAVLNDKSEKKLSFGDIPWPCRGSVENVVDILFGDKTDWTSSALRKYVREQQIRWHPDKFLQKFIDRIAPKSFEKVMERVKEISQALNKKAESLTAS